ncbi:Alb1p [Saccharomyces eubayanus]|uniref:Alb1p n=1 Tax=Saccharomyces eubayanus TaxID=1080349 RepID=UPI0006C03832|nr:ALB1-like protein [Saccharomyces eubayanus]KOG98493.1 ALB1-like protein [Saccharomyces eubayanus]
MPSKNSINRPKLTSNLNHRVHSLGKKRAQREKAGLLQPARSSANSRSGEIKSVALDLYFQNKKDAGETSTAVTLPTPPSHPASITTRTLSKKRAKKIERNLKYAAQRKLLVDASAKVEDDMDIDLDSTKKVKENEKKKSSLTLVKEALWNVIDDTSSHGLLIENGQGTTLGGPFFP